MPDFQGDTFSELSDATRFGHASHKNMDTQRTAMYQQFPGPALTAQPQPSTCLPSSRRSRAALVVKLNFTSTQDSQVILGLRVRLPPVGLDMVLPWTTVRILMIAALAGWRSGLGLGVLIVQKSPAKGTLKQVGL